MSGIINLNLGTSSSGAGSTGISLLPSTGTTGTGGIGVTVVTPVTGSVTAGLGLPSTSSTTGASGDGTASTLVTTPVLDATVTTGGSTGVAVDVTTGSGATSPSGGGGVTVSVGVGGSTTTTSDPTTGHTDPGVGVTAPVVGGTVTVGGSDGATGGGVTTGAGGTSTSGMGGAGGVTVTVGGGGTSTTTTLSGGDPTGGHAAGSDAGAPTTPDAQTAYVNIFRLATTADIPTDAQVQLIQLQQQVNTGAITAVQAVLKVADMAAGATAVAETSYQFFSGLTPTADGLNYLVHSASNPTDLSDSYYASFNLENRYINFASNLGLHSDYAPQFAQVYGSMSFQDAVATAYDRIVGDAQATAAGIDYKAAIADIVSRQPYFAEVAHERFGTDNQDLSTKLAAIAYIMEEGVRADVGRYGQADQNFLFDLADGHAQHHVDLVGTYGSGGPTNLTTG